MSYKYENIKLPKSTALSFGIFSNDLVFQSFVNPVDFINFPVYKALRDFLVSNFKVEFKNYWFDILEASIAEN